MGRVEQMQHRQETLVLLAGKKSKGVQATRDSKDKITPKGEGTWFSYEIKLIIIFGEVLGKNQNEIRRKPQNILSWKGPHRDWTLVSQKYVCSHYCSCNLVQGTRQLSQQDPSMLEKGEQKTGSEETERGEGCRSKGRMCLWGALPGCSLPWEKSKVRVWGRGGNNSQEKHVDQGKPGYSCVLL